MKHQRWLLGEIDAWLAEGLIDEQHAVALRKRYASQAQSLPWARIIFSSIGAVLLGLGLILLFAYNWAAMPKFAKLAVVFATLIGAHGAALWCRDPARFHPALGESLQLLGTMLFGAGIWLVAQIYHIDEHYPNAFLIWSLGALALAWARPSIAQGIAACLLIGLWHGSKVFDFQTPNHLVLLLLLAGVAPLALWLRSRVLLFMALGTLYFVIGANLAVFADEWLLPTVLALACLLLALRGIAERGAWFPESAGTLSVLGYPVYFFCVYLLSFPDVLGDVIDPGHDTLALVYLASLALPALGLWGWLLIQQSTAAQRPGLAQWLDQGLVVGVLSVLLLAILFAHDGGRSTQAVALAWLALILCNIALLIHGGVFIICGSAERRPGLTALGVVLIAAVIVTRYLDLFHSLLMRSLAFFIIGAIVFLAGNFYSRRQPGGITS